MKHKILFTFLTSLLLLTMNQTSYASQSDLDKDIRYYADIFAGNNFAQQRSAMEKLIWAGISSPAVYDSLADKLASSKESKNKEEVERASWYAKALALSGNEKYRALLDDISANAKSSKLRKYSTQAITRLDKYVAWNPVISQSLISAPTGALEQQRIKNMLSASDLELTRIGAKRVYHEHSMDDALMKIDTVAWLIKGIGRSANPSYKGMLESIAASNKNSKIRKYAKKALKNY